MTTKLNKTIRPVKKDIVFTGKLYFESISKRQMDQLIWLLNSGNEKLGLKLGGAKPLGFGSISCQVQCVQERVIRLKNGNLNYELMELPVDGITYESAGFSSTVKKEFYKIAGLETIPENVEITYPKTIEQKGQPLTEGFKWFVNNHKTLSGGGMRGRNNVRIETVLPSILDEDVSMNIISHLKHPEVVQKVLMEVQEKHLVMEGIEVILREISERTIREEGINNAVICQYTT